MAIEMTNRLTLLQAAEGGKGLPGPAHTQISAHVRSPSSVQKVTKPEETAQTDLGGIEKKAGAAAQSGQQAPDTKSLEKLVEMVNEKPQIRNRSLEFSTDDSTGKMMVRVYDADTNELIRQFPPEELLALAERIQEILDDDAASFMLQEKA